MSARLWWLLLAILFIVSAIARQGMLAMLAVILALATATSYLWARYGLSNVTYHRRLGREQISFGEETSLRLEFTNAKPLPLAWLLVRDRFPRPVQLLTEAVRSGPPHQPAWLVSILALRWYERVTRTHRVLGQQRGVFAFGPAEMSSGDVFGFRRRQQEVPGVDTLTVFPKIVPVEALGLPAGRPMGDWLPRQRILEDPLRMSSVREYVPGDNPRYIHWKASGHSGSLQSKVFDPSATLSLSLAADVQTAPRAYDYIPEYLELILSAAGSLALRALEERHMVGLCTNAFGREGELWGHLPPSRHPEQATRMLEMLAAARPFAGLTGESMLLQLLPALPLGATVVALTARPAEPLYEALDRLERAGHRTLLLTVGEDRPAVPAALESHHLGGRDAWEHLAALELA